MPKNSDIRFNSKDPLMLDMQLSEGERMIRDTAKKYAQNKLLPRVIKANRDGVFDRKIMTELGDQGLLGAMVSPKYGGSGVSHVVYGLIAREIESVDSGYRSAMSVQSSLVMYPIEAFGSEDQKLSLIHI